MMDDCIICDNGVITGINIGDESYFIDFDISDKSIILTRMLKECSGCPYYNCDTDDPDYCNGCYGEFRPDGQCNTTHIRNNMLWDSYELTSTYDIMNEEDFDDNVKEALLKLYEEVIEYVY